MFQLGKLVQTSGVHHESGNDPVFAHNVHACLTRYRKGDWGDLSDEDKKMNDEALKDGDQILAAYEVPTSQATTRKIYIVTEWDRSVTTILFPEEY
jgi:hypothetical protein